MAEIEVRGLTKTFGRVTAVRDVSFTAPAGMVTGLLGPNGSGKTTTLRIALGLVQASAGEALIGGSAYRRLDRPRRVVGAMLESTGFPPGAPGPRPPAGPRRQRMTSRPGGWTRCSTWPG